MAKTFKHSLNVGWNVELRLLRRFMSIQAALISLLASQPPSTSRLTPVIPIQNPALRLNARNQQAVIQKQKVLI